MLIEIWIDGGEDLRIGLEVFSGRESSQGTKIHRCGIGLEPVGELQGGELSLAGDSGTDSED